jgi:cell wall-associated NlpC family hydrolase
LKFGNYRYKRQLEKMMHKIKGFILEVMISMSWYTDYKLVKDGDAYILEIYLNPDDTEFSREFFLDTRENILELDGQIRDFVKGKFSDIKINTVKLLLGAVVVGTIPFLSITNAAAAEANTTQSAIIPTATTTQAQIQTNNISLLNTTGTVQASILNIRSGPSTTYSILAKLPLGGQLLVTGGINGWYQVQLPDGRTGYVSNLYMKLETPTKAQNIGLVLAVAKSLIGTPYVWGGNSLQSGGFDCSGLTQYSFKQAGYTLNRVSVDQATQGMTVTRDSLQPGDLVFFSLAGDNRISHVGIYIGDGKMINSPKTGDFVKNTDITTSFWQTRFIIAKRIIY